MPGALIIKESLIIFNLYFRFKMTFDNYGRTLSREMVKLSALRSWKQLSARLSKVSRWVLYSETCLKRPLKRRQNIGFQDRLLLYVGEKYCRMLSRLLLNVDESIAECSKRAFCNTFDLH